MIPPTPDAPLKPIRMGPGGRKRWWQQWSRRRKIITIVAIALLLIAIALGVGLGVGLTQGGGSEEGGSGSASPTPGNTPNSTTFYGWKPEAGTKWQIVLQYPLNDTSVDVPVYDIDLFTNNASTIDELHHQGRKVICYFSAGSYENFRPDADEFKSQDLGKVLDGWPDEKWLDTNSQNVRRIMLHRLDMAVDKNCDGVDPDNIDGYVSFFFFFFWP
jgi:hypothetical protein